MMSRRALIIILLAILTLIGVYFIIDPAKSEWMPKCIFHSFTGLQCPGCGSQRMFHALLHGDLREAWHFNPFLLLLIPLLILLAFTEFMPSKCPRLFKTLHTPASIIILAIAITGWTIARNIFL